MARKPVKKTVGSPKKHGRNTRRPSAMTPQQWLVDWLTDGQQSDSGITVNARTALQYAAVWQAVNTLAGDLGTLPLVIYRRTKDGRERDVGHPAFQLLKRRPNRMMGALTFKQLLTSHALLWGNGRAGIVRNGRGDPIELVPFLPDRSHEEIIDGELWHMTKLGEDQVYTPFKDENVLHIKGLGFDGTTGYSVISLARNSFGLGLATEKHGNKSFKNQARPAVVLETDGSFREEDAKKLLRDWEQMHSGPDNIGKTALLQRGITAKTLSMSNTDAEWLDTRNFQRQEVAAWFNLPPHKVGDSSRLSYNSIEAENQAYLNSSLMRWLVTWQEECDEKLLSWAQQDNDSHYTEFLTQALLRADIQARYAAYQIGIASEFLSPNEVRALENMNKRADGGGDLYKNPNTKSATDQKPTEEKQPAKNRMNGALNHAN